MKCQRLNGKEAMGFAPRPHRPISSNQQALLALRLRQARLQCTNGGPHGSARLRGSNMLPLQTADEILLLDAALQRLSRQILAVLGQRMPRALLPESNLVSMLV